ncbi:MAG: hypothetical protein PUC12_17165 [Clostridiales bacterium]|nr:hypothetical protein [Clostridiales bacterium]
MENVTDNACRSVFVHNTEELSEAFTELWTQLINEKEESFNCLCENDILQTSVSGL